MKRSVFQRLVRIKLGTIEGRHRAGLTTPGEALGHAALGVAYAIVTKNDDAACDCLAEAVAWIHYWVESDA